MVFLNGVEATKVICKTSAGSVTASPIDPGVWLAEMGPIPNGPVMVRVVGKSTGRNAAVMLANVIVDSGMCRNKTDRARVQGMTGPMDCACIGLPSKLGDKVVIRVKGTYTGGGGGDEE